MKVKDTPKDAPVADDVNQINDHLIKVKEHSERIPGTLAGFTLLVDTKGQFHVIVGRGVSPSVYRELVINLM